MTWIDSLGANLEFRSYQMLGNFFRDFLFGGKLVQFLQEFFISVKNKLTLILSIAISTNCNFDKLQLQFLFHINSMASSPETVEAAKRRIYLELDAMRKREARKRIRELEKENIAPAVKNKKERSLSHRRQHELSKELENSFFHIVRNCADDNSKGLVAQSFIKRIKHLPHVTLADPKELNVMKDVISNVRETMQAQKFQRNTDVLIARKSTLQMAVSTVKGINQSAFSRLLSIPRKTVTQAFRRRICAEFDAGPWSMHARKKRSDALSPEEIAAVRKFWDENTRVSPYKKHVRKHVTESGERIDHPIHLLEVTQLQLYLAFQKEHADLKISQQTFERLKPSYIRKLQERETCCCQYHLHLEFAMQAINKMRTDPYGVHKDCKCKCRICGSGPTCLAKEHTIKSTSEYWRQIVCSKDENEEWYKHACLMQTCTKCGLKRLPTCPREKVKNNRQDVNWKVFEKQEVQNKKTRSGKKPAKVTRLAYKSGSPFEFHEHATKTLKTFVPHNYRAHWQAKQFKQCLASIQEDTIVSVIDFAENYGFKIQQEAQSCHWHTDQVSILVHITYRRMRRSEAEERQKKEEDNKDSKKKNVAKEKRQDSLKGIVKETHFYISDDKTHDTEFVQHCLQNHADWLQSIGVNYKKHVFWSDGCSAQFKSSRPFYFLGRFHNRLEKDIIWNFFASSHGKGEHDGAGAVIKRILTKEQMKYNGRKLQCAKEVVAFLRWHFSNNPSDNDLSRYFWDIESSKIDRSDRFDCHTLKGTTQLHCIRPCDRENTLKVAYRPLSCFCESCVQFQWDLCSTKPRIGGWETCELKLKEINSANDANKTTDEDLQIEDEHEEEEEEEDYDITSSMVEVGDNFAVNAEEGNEEGVDFYVLKCREAKNTLLEDYVDGWGNVFGVESVIVSGHYYKQLGGLQFELLDDQPVASVYSHLVRLANFEMIADEENCGLYTMSEDTCQQIMCNLPNSG